METYTVGVCACACVCVCVWCVSYISSILGKKSHRNPCPHFFLAFNHAPEPTVGIVRGCHIGSEGFRGVARGREERRGEWEHEGEGAEKHIFFFGQKRRERENFDFFLDPNLKQVYNSTACVTHFLKHTKSFTHNIYHSV